MISKNLTGGNEFVLDEPKDILQEIKKLDGESREILGSIKNLIK
mgnify:CR=1 FL=1